MGLLAGRQAGIKIEQKHWEEIQKFYVDTQMKVGRHGRLAVSSRSVGTPSHTMTLAGLAGLYITGLEQNIGKQQLNENTGVAAKCGVYDENEAVGRNALARQALQLPRNV